MNNLYIRTCMVKCPSAYINTHIYPHIQLHIYNRILNQLITLQIRFSELNVNEILVNHVGQMRPCGKGSMALHIYIHDDINIYMYSCIVDWTTLGPLNSIILAATVIRRENALVASNYIHFRCTRATSTNIAGECVSSCMSMGIQVYQQL